MTKVESTLPAEKRQRVLTLANKITIARILCIPVIVIGLIEQKPLWVYFLLGFSVITDFLDGLAARIRGERTRLGAFLDPMADKLLLTSVFMALTYLNTIDTWVFVVIFSRDLLIVLGWAVIFILTGSSAIKPRILGKVATAVQMATALGCIVSLPTGALKFLIWSTVALTAASAIDYVMVGEKRLGEWS